MQIELINQTYHEKLEDFKLKTVKRKWNILTMVVEGEYALRFKGTDKTLVLRKNDIALLPAEMEFERWVKSPVTYYHISFHAQPDDIFYLSAPTGKFNLPSEQAAAIFRTMARAFLLPDNRELIIHTVERAFVENHLFGGRSKERVKPLSDAVESAVRYMRNNFERKIDMDELAERVFLSHSGLIWKFKKELNTTPTNYLSILRLRYAKQLLLHYPYSITKISEMCGYSNPYYFTNAFRRHTGMSPTDFRKRYLKEKEPEQAEGKKS